MPPLPSDHTQQNMESISNIGISEAQQRVEQTPSGLIAPPVATGDYQIDESVVECRLAKADGLREVVSLMKALSVSRERLNGCSCIESWRVLVGQNSKGDRSSTRWRCPDLFFEGQ